LTVFLVNFMENLSEFLGLLHRLCGRVMFRVLSDMFGEKRLGLPDEKVALLYTLPDKKFSSWNS
jgi:hypothetical protein